MEAVDRNNKIIRGNKKGIIQNLFNSAKEANDALQKVIEIRDNATYTATYIENKINDMKTKLDLVPNNISSVELSELVNYSIDIREYALNIKS